MNPFYNEIRKKPEKTEKNKIPAGAICGNGDVAVILDDENDDLLLHLAKCDFWKFAPTHDADGGIKTIGQIRIQKAGLSRYFVRQSMAEGLLSCQFGNVNLEVFASPGNIVYMELSAPDDRSFPFFTVEIPDTSGSRNFSYADQGLKWYLRKFDGKTVVRESAAALCCRRMETRRADGMKTIRFCLSVVTNFDSAEYISRSIALALQADYERDKIRTARYWKEFFSASRVHLSDKKIEKIYNGSLYLLACCMGNKTFPPGLFGNFITDDDFPWGGDYHLNYNYEAPFYAVFSSNHPSLAEGYMQPLYDMLEKGKAFSALLHCQGVYFPVSFGPKGLDLYTMKTSKEHGILFLGQKSNASYAAVVPILYWYATYDKSYAKKRLYPYLKEVGAFWESYLKKENGRYVIQNDAIHEVPFYKGAAFQPEHYRKQIEAKNNLLSLGLVRMLFKALIDMASEIGEDADKLPLWQDILDNISEFPTFIKHGKRCFRYTEKGIRWVRTNSLCIQHVYPASQIGLSSDKKTLKTAKNTYFIHDRRLDDNGSVSYLPCGARLGVSPDFLLEGLRMNIEKFGLPNMLFRHTGGCLEHLATVPATINEMLLQSHEGVIRLFPCWNKNENAAFENLRADGAFLVSASLKKGKITALQIKSLQGRKCCVEIPADKKLNLHTPDGKRLKYKKANGRMEFATVPNGIYILL